MDNQERLVDQLKKNLSKLDDKQKEAFRQSLKRQIPGVIRRAVRDAQQKSKQENEK